MDAGTISILLKATDQASSVLGDVEQKAGGVGSKLGEVGRTAAGFVIGSALTNLPGKLIEMAKGAAEDAASTAKLQQAVTNAEGSFDGHAAAIDTAISNGQKLAFSDDQVRDGLAILTATTGDADEAMRRIGIAQDLARGTGMDLVTASKLVGRVNDENVNVLSRYGIQVDKNATAQDLLNAVDGKFGGQAATFAASDAGKMAIMTDKVGELQEQLGAYLIPVLSLAVGAIIGIVDAGARFLSVFEPVATFIQANLTPILIFLTPAIIGLGVAMLASLIPALISGAVALWAQVAAWIALNLAMLPIIAVFVLIGAALVLLYLAWQSNFMGIQGIVATLVGYLSTAWDAVVTVFNVVLPAAMQTLQGYWQVFSSVVSGVVAIIAALLTGDFAGAWDAAKTMVSGVIDGIGQIVGGLPALVLGFIVDMATQAGQKLAEWATEAATKAGEFLSGIVSAITSLPGDIAGIVTDMAGQAVTLLAGLVTDAVSKGGEILSGIITAITSLPGDVAGIVTDMAGQAVELLGGLVTDAGTKAGEILSGIITAITSLPTDVWNLFDSMRTQAVAVIDDLKTNAPGWGRDILQGLINGITGLFGTLAGAMSAMQTAVTSSVSTASSWLYDAGKNIITGLISGIEDMAWQAAQAAIAVVRDAVNAAKSWLGISSPSKLARDILGQPFSQGIARGIMAGVPGIERAATAAVSATMANSPALGAGGLSPLAAGTLSGAALSGSVGDGRRAGLAAAGGASVAVNYYGPVTIEAQDRSAADRASRDIGWAVQASLRARGAA